MSNGNEPAYPHLHDTCQRINESEYWPGLTKRERYAMAAMEGLLARYGVSELAVLDIAESAFTATKLTPC